MPCFLVVLFIVTLMKLEFINIIQVSVRFLSDFSYTFWATIFSFVNNIFPIHSCGQFFKFRSATTSVYILLDKYAGNAIFLVDNWPFNSVTSQQKALMCPGFASGNWRSLPWQKIIFRFWAVGWTKHTHFNIFQFKYLSICVLFNWSTMLSTPDDMYVEATMRISTFSWVLGLCPILWC